MSWGGGSRVSTFFEKLFVNSYKCPCACACAMLFKFLANVCQMST